MRKQLIGALGAASLAVLAGGSLTASAEPITYLLTGDISGNLNGTTFTNDPFTWTITGDTSQKTTCCGGFPGVPAITDILDISGIGVLTPTAALFAASNASAGIAAYANASANSGLAWTSSGLHAWDPGTPIGPLSVTEQATFPVATNDGSLSISGTSGLVFSAAVPEPATLALFGLGLLGVGLSRRRFAC